MNELAFFSPALCASSLHSSVLRVQLFDGPLRSAFSVDSYPRRIRCDSGDLPCDCLSDKSGSGLIGAAKY